MKLVEKSPGIYHLHDNHVEILCPFQPAIPMQEQSTMGQVSLNLIRVPCTTACALCEETEGLPDEGIEAHVHLNCGGQKVTYDIEKIERVNLEPKKKGLFLTKGDA